MAQSNKNVIIDKEMKQMAEMNQMASHRIIPDDSSTADRDKKLAEMKAKYEAELQEYNRKLAEYEAAHPEAKEPRHVNPHTAVLNGANVSQVKPNLTVNLITKLFGL
jgi:ABC-type transporter MlaC component